MMTAIRDSLIEAAYYQDGNDLANQIVLCDEELSGVRPATAPMAELRQRLDYWLHLASKRWAVFFVLQDDNTFKAEVATPV